MFGSGSTKKNSQQEMVQVDRSDSDSSFWKTPSRDSSKRVGPSPGPGSGSGPNQDQPSIVVGAAYSHADLLKVDSLQLSGPSRPRTPPATVRRIPSHTLDATPPSRPPTASGRSSPPLKTYFSYLSTTNDDWKADDDDDDADDGFDFEDEDGDEFGLPSLTTMKRKPRRSLAAGETGSGSRLRRFSNSADIAIERPLALYPMPKKSEGKILRPQYKDILKDPANALHLISHPSTAPTASQKEIETINSKITRINKFKKLLQASTVPLPDLKQLAWSGIPQEVRAMTWQLLLSYLPTNSERRVSTLERKRKEYLEAVKYLETAKQSSSEGTGPNTGRGRGIDEAIWHQIKIDVPRTNPHLELYGYETTKRSLERILYVWAVRHSACGYVQGINDLVTPFWQVFLGSYITDPDIESGMDPGQLPKPVLDAVEADSFWCLTKLLDGILDHYIVGQPGIQRQVKALRDLTARVHAPLVRHLEDEKVEFIQFSFRWMNCLLMREFSVRNTIRMWDTYLAEEEGFSEFHLYVCAAFLVKWSDKLCKMDFQDIMMFLQSLPTKNWTEKDIELLLSEAFIWQSLFKGSSAHLRGPSSQRLPSEHMQL